MVCGRQYERDNEIARWMVMPGLNKLKIREQIISLDIEELLKQKKGQLFLKRVFDYLISLVGLIVLCPLLLLIAILIKTDSKGKVFFKQVRVGQYEKEFKIIKFRTMIVDAELKGMQITVGNDNRITKPGHFLRKFKLDELPQLINVLMGDMSFVGPRPEVPKYVSMYNDMQKNVLKVRPGITDLASIEYRNENTILSQSNTPERMYIDEIMPRKIELNLEYIKHISLLYDIKLIFKTIYKVIK